MILEADGTLGESEFRENPVTHDQLEYVEIELSNLRLLWQKPANYDLTHSPEVKVQLTVSPSGNTYVQVVPKGTQDPSKKRAALEKQLRKDLEARLKQDEDEAKRVADIDKKAGKAAKEAAIRFGTPADIVGPIDDDDDELKPAVPATSETSAIQPPVPSAEADTTTANRATLLGIGGLGVPASRNTSDVPNVDEAEAERRIRSANPTASGQPAPDVTSNR